MALLGSPESSRGILGAIRGSLGLFSNLNKAEGLNENANAIPADQYESSLTEEEIIELTAQWQRTYRVYEDVISRTQDLAYNYWLGNHRTDDNTSINSRADMKEVVDNLIFEAVETFLPIATRANPDPLVSADPGDLGQKLSHDIKAFLVSEADRQKLKRKLAKLTRHWILYRIGAVKVSWDSQTKEIETEVINPRRMIFDVDGHIDEGGHFDGEYLGEKKKLSAATLKRMFPKKEKEIAIKARDKEGTKLDFIEWWYRQDQRWEDVFYTLDDIVLGKYKNPHWNFAGKTTDKDPETGEVTETEIQGTNHFERMEAPYVFLSVFNTASRPHDDTGLIMQNLTVQDMINRRWRAIDRNIQSMNNGLVVSGTAFTEEQASQAASALNRGVAIRVPNGRVQDAVQRFAAEPLPKDVYESLQDGRSELRNIFGTSGLTAQGVQSEDTVRGKIMVNQQDTSRIGGGVTEHIEQVADSLYNWWVQMAFVYFDEEHFLTTAGQQGGMDLVIIKNSDFPLLKSLIVTVKEGSLIPKDPLTQRNEAIDLWSANAIDPFNFYKKLDFPDPAQATQQLILWQMLQKGQIPPQAYLPSFQMPQAQPVPLPNQEPGTGGPAVSPPSNQGVENPPQENNVQQQGRQLLESVPIK